MKEIKKERAHKGTRSQNQDYYIKILDNVKPHTYCYTILGHLIKHKSITSMQAFSEYGITRLSAVIYELKNDYGVPIISKNRTSKNSNGHVVTFSEYRLEA